MKAVYRALMKGSLVRTFAGVTGFLGIPREQREVMKALSVQFENKCQSYELKVAIFHTALLSPQLQKMVRVLLKVEW